jgi:hypothetical protein
MPAFFVPFSAVTPTGSALLVEGSVSVSEAVSAGTKAAVNEMALLGRVGELLRCRVVNGVLTVAAKVWNRTAIAKVIDRVYAGFTLLCSPADDGLTVEKVSLVDRPDALKKRRGGGQPMDLIFEKGVKLMLSSNDRPAKRPDAVLNEVLPRFKEYGAQIESQAMAKGGQVDPRVRAAYNLAAEELLKYNRKTQAPFRPQWAGPR